MFNLKNTCVYMNNYPFVNNRGEVHLCCKNNKHQLEGNIKTHKLKDIFFSDQMQQLREQMLREEPLNGCDICYSQEERGEKSFRLRALVSLRKQKFSELEPYNDLKIRHLDLRVGSLCNLMCTMCHPSDSSKWQQNYRTYASSVTQKKDNHIGIIENDYNPSSMDWATYDQSWDNIISGLDNDLKTLYIAGGEPFYIKKFPEYVISLLDRTPDTSITVNTNGTRLLSEKNIKKLNKNLFLRISIDGFDLAEEYQRAGTSWQEKIEVIDQYYRNFKILSFDITLTSFTIRSLPKLVSFLQERYPDIDLMFRPVVNRPVQDIRILPKHLIKETLDFCNKLKENNFSKVQYINIDQIIAFLQEEKEGDLSELSRFVNYWDKLSDIKLESFDSELSDWVYANNSS